MPVELLTILQFGLLGLLYLFVARTVYGASRELYGGRKRAPAPANAGPSPTPRPSGGAPAPVAQPAQDKRRSRKIPKEVVIRAADGAGSRVVALAGHGLVLGRGDSANVFIDDVYASDEHAQILPDDGSWSVRDLGSTNGTYLNGAKVTRPTPLAVGDQLRVGKTIIEVGR